MAMHHHPDWGLVWSQGPQPIYLKRSASSQRRGAALWCKGKKGEGSMEVGEAVEEEEERGNYYPQPTLWHLEGLS